MGGPVREPTKKAIINSVHVEKSFHFQLSGSALAPYSNVEVMVNHTFLSIEHLWNNN